MSEAVIIVGAGWAGLAAAYKLAEAGKKIILLEAAPKAGGRARGVPFGDEIVDNGQHLMIGAYTETLNLLKSLKIKEDDIFLRQPQNWSISESSEESVLKYIRIKLLRIFSPFHLFFGFLFAKGFSVKDRWSIFKFWRSMQRMDFILKKDCSILELLHEYNVNPRVIDFFFGPLALAALSTPIENASAQIFLNTLKSTFSTNRMHSDFLFPKVDLSNVLPNPIIIFLKQKGSNIHFNERALSIDTKNQKFLVYTEKNTYEADHIILATPPNVTAKLLREYSKVDSERHSMPFLLSNLEQFKYEPITTIYCHYDKKINLPNPMQGFVNSTLQWVFDRGFCQQPNLLSGVITGNRDFLINKIIEEINQWYPHLGLPLKTKIITEKRAAFSCLVDIDKIRPTSKTPIPELYLAGDYTQTGKPACLEGAIESGFNAAQLILSSNGSLVESN